MDFKCVIRPFINRPSVAYELVLIRSEGDRLYDRRIAILSGTDARDFMRAVSGIEFTEAPRSYLQDEVKDGH